MGSLGGLLTQMSHYSIASLATMVAGLISYPILTRVLQVHEYGIMGLVVTVLSLLTGVAKLGLQFSIVRFWPVQAREPLGEQRFILTLFIGMLGAAVLVQALYLAAVIGLSPRLSGRLGFFLLISSPLLLIRSCTSYGTALLRARERSLSCASFEVFTCYTGMMLAVLGATAVVGGLTGYYLGLTLGEGLVAAALIVTVLHHTPWQRRLLRPALLRQAVAFGFPMSLSELSAVLFAMADRFVIIWLLGETALGYYAVAFNLASYIGRLFSESLNRAAVPIYTNLYETAGVEATRQFLRRAGRAYFLFVLPAIAGMIVVREDLLLLLASRKFLPGVELVHIQLAAFLTYGSVTILGAGLFLKKQPWRMAQLNLGASLLNLALNLALIPWLGLRGAALATLVTQVGLAGMMWLLGARLVSPGLDLRALLCHGSCALLMAALASCIRPEPCALRLVLRVLIGAVVYGALLVALDREARAVARRVALRCGILS